MEDNQYKILIDLCNSYLNDYNKENSRRTLFASSDNQKKFRSLIDQYSAFAKIHEDTIANMYIDSNGYPTIGCGHLLGFDWSGFWKLDNRIVQDILEDLKEQIVKKKLVDDPAFTNLPMPSNVSSFLSLSEKNLQNLYRITSVCLGFLDAKSLFTSPLNDSLAVCKAYTDLLQINLKLYARQKSLHKIPGNPFKARAFFNSEGPNSLVLGAMEVDALLNRDILVKLGELRNKFNEVSNRTNTFIFDSFPEAAQLGLLELCYNMGLPIEVKRLAVQKKWKDLQNIALYNRPKPAYEKRNIAVKNWFKIAEDTSKTVN